TTHFRSMPTMRDAMSSILSRRMISEGRRVQLMKTMSGSRPHGSGSCRVWRSHSERLADGRGIDEFCPSGRIILRQSGRAARPSPCSFSTPLPCARGPRGSGLRNPDPLPPARRCRRASTTTGGVFRAIPDNSGKLGQLSELRTTTNPQARTHRRREARSRHPRSPGHYHWRPSSSLGPIEKSVRFRPGIYLRQTRR
ncbi:hypothetical protein SAMN04244576_06585, partial [Sinorhizobium meliloti]